MMLSCSSMSLSYTRPLWKNQHWSWNCGRIYSTGGSSAPHLIQVDGRVSASGQAQINEVAGPRIAHGVGRFSRFRATGPGPGQAPQVSAQAFGAPFGQVRACVRNQAIGIGGEANVNLRPNDTRVPILVNRSSSSQPYPAHFPVSRASV
jgi:hypothetical protein